MKAKWNVMDGIILLVLLIAVAAGGFFLSGRGKTQTQAQNKTVQLVVELKEEREAFTSLPKVGDAVAVGEKEKMQTVVTHVEVKPATKLTYDTINGRGLETEIPGRYDVLLTLQGSGTENDRTVEIAGNAVRVGNEVVVRNKNWAGAGFILAVDTIEE